MTITQFNNLNRKQKLLAIYTKGKKVAYKIAPTCDIIFNNCYAIDNFFVEQVYNHSKRKITEINAFVDGDKLDYYSHVTLWGIVEEDPWGAKAYMAKTHKAEQRIGFNEIVYNEAITVEVAKAINTLDFSQLERICDSSLLYEEQEPIFTVSGRGVIIKHFDLMFNKQQYFAEIGYFNMKKDKPCIILSRDTKDNKVAVLMVNTLKNKVIRLDYCTIFPGLYFIEQIGYFPV